MLFKYIAISLLYFVKFVNCEHGKISREKCIEYAKAVYTVEESPVMMVTRTKNEIAECALESGVPLIIGGVKAVEGEFPHMGIIGFGSSPDAEDLNWSCGSALISERYILTAAHCSNSRGHGPAQKVRFGIIDTNLETDDFNEDIFQEKVIIERIIHPLYKRPSKYNDIALFLLDSKVIFTPYVRPACLNTNPYIKEKKAIAAGFGKLSNDAMVGSDKLMKVDLFIYVRDVCKKYFKRGITMRKGLVESMMCAGDLAGGKDTCQGDSGGPLQIILDEPYCMYNLIGVTSFGRFCGFANSPAIYSNVSDFIPWIENIVWKSNSSIN